jgi:hypothetical protein
MASRASTARGTNSAADASDPATRAETTNISRWPASTTADETTTPGQLWRATSPSRASVSAVRNARAHRDEPDDPHETDASPAPDPPRSRIATTAPTTPATASAMADASAR